MTEQERKVEKLDERVTNLERQVSETTINVNGLIRALQDFKTEMRDRDNQRAEDIREIRQDINEMGKHVRNLSLTAMAAIGAMVVTVIVSLLKS